jgi:hypothetical protein
MIERYTVVTEAIANALERNNIPMSQTQMAIVEIYVGGLLVMVKKYGLEETLKKLGGGKK